MNRWNRRISLWFPGAVAICTVFAMFVFSGGRVSADDATKPWVAPEDAKNVKNPFPPTPENLAAGAETYKNNCELCHGTKGLGDGGGAPFISVRPANFTDEKLMSAETDGSLFWKMSEGRGPMPPWNDTLTENERWQLVDYIRKLEKDANK